MKDILGIILLPLTIPLIIIALILLQIKVMWQIVADRKGKIGSNFDDFLKEEGLYNEITERIKKEEG